MVSEWLKEIVSALKRLLGLALESDGRYPWHAYTSMYAYHLEKNVGPRLKDALVHVRLGWKVKSLIQR